ncbi:MAG: PHP domain-containing protein [Pedosphaera sp.]|nr:PHP domain-containing protein [Pedosphaera sp.]
MYADLHLHTKYSDGTFTPQELVDRAFNAGLRTLSLTDHDTMDGCQEMMDACAKLGLNFITGCEFTVEFQDQELHLLGYGMRLENPELQSTLRHYQSVRRERIVKMTERLGELGIPIRPEAVFEIAQCNAPGRPHLARALIASGHCANLDQAFTNYLKKGKPAWVSKPKMNATNAIDLIHRTGGVAVMAHPGVTRKDDLIDGLVAVGMDGLECFYIRHSTPITEHYLLLADKHSLLVTGGSDCHGMSKGHPLIGKIKLESPFVEKLQRAIQNRQSAISTAV